MILKICGITSQEDADAAIAAGANAIGFNFYPRSPRYIGPGQAAGIRTAAGVRRVGVFVNEARARVEETARAARLDVAQLHGDEPPEDYPAGIAVWKAVRVGPDFDFACLEGCSADALVLDGPAGQLYGGMGRVFDWKLANGGRLAGESACPICRIVLAGGLDAGNVARAVAVVRPWGVDACSRLESAPGKKDHRKMKEFLQAAKAALGA